MKISFGTLTFSLVFIVATMSCSAKDDMVLDYKDVQFFKLKETNGHPPYSLELSGLAFHSALAVEKIDTDVNQPVLTVYVHLVPAKKGLSGSFEYKFIVPQDVSEVRFGNDQHKIWVRPQ